MAPDVAWGRAVASYYPPWRPATRQHPSKDSLRMMIKEAVRSAPSDCPASSNSCCLMLPHLRFLKHATIALYCLIHATIAPFTPPLPHAASSMPPSPHAALLLLPLPQAASFMLPQAISFMLPHSCRHCLLLPHSHCHSPMLPHSCCHMHATLASGHRTHAASCHHGLTPHHSQSQQA